MGVFQECFKSVYYSFSRCDMLMQVSHLLLVLNSSINILIYSWKDRKFRAVLTSKLGLVDTTIIGVDWEHVTNISQSVVARRSIFTPLNRSSKCVDQPSSFGQACDLSCEAAAKGTAIGGELRQNAHDGSGVIY